MEHSKQLIGTRLRSCFQILSLIRASRPYHQVSGTLGVQRWFSQIRIWGVESFDRSSPQATVTPKTLAFTELTTSSRTCSDVCTIRCNMTPASNSASALPVRTVFGYRGKCFMIRCWLPLLAQRTLCMAHRASPRPDTSGHRTGSPRFCEGCSHEFSVSKQIFFAIPLYARAFKSRTDS